MKSNIVLIGFENHYSGQLRELLLQNASVSSVNPIETGQGNHIHNCLEADVAVLNGHEPDYLRWFRHCISQTKKTPPASLIIGDETSTAKYFEEERRNAPRLHIANEALTSSRLSNALQQLASARYLPPINREESTEHIPAIEGDYRQEDSSHYEALPDLPVKPEPFSNKSLQQKKTFIGAYQLSQLLGKGGMGAVYQAMSPDNDIVAIKLLDLAKLPDDRFLDRFIDEYELLSKIDHPNVVKVYEQGFTDNHAYIVMELLSQDNLKTRIRKGLSVRQAIRYAIDLSDALATIHDLGILHRDMKSSNVLFNQHEQPVITDFGIARTAVKDMELTMQGEAVGTPAYMSPEQALGHAVTTSSDLYSFGIMLYRMLTGELPFQAKSPIIMLQKQVDSPPPHLPSELIDIDPIVQRLLCKQPTRRYQSAWELQEELKPLLA